ncbi:MAG: hypothetical protein GXX79_01375 [Actinomycetales bacterium]|nr:hypothetical protein [Actinomycetales bacterium]
MTIDARASALVTRTTPVVALASTRRRPVRRLAGAAAAALGWLRPPAVGIAALAAGAGLLLQGCAVSLGHTAYDDALKLFWPAQLLPFAVFGALLLFRELSLRERTVVVALVGVVPSISYRFTDLQQFIGFDELLHQRTLNDLVGGSGLFGENPLLAVSPFYPGMEALTGILTRLTGTPGMATAMLVVVACRLLLVLGIFQLARTCTSSDVRASLVVLVYACCPQFFSFNSQFAYQTVALTFGVGALLLLRTAQRADGTTRTRLVLAAVVCLAAVTVTHHATSWLVLGFLWLYVLVARGGNRRVALHGALAGTVLLLAWTALLVRRLYDYFLPMLLEAVDGVTSSLGGSAERELFNDTSGVRAPVGEQAALVVYAIVVTTTALVAGALLLRDAVRTRDRGLALLGMLAMAYPVTLVGRFAHAAAEVGDRASTFLFLPLALATARVVETRVLDRSGRSGRIHGARTPRIAALGVLGVVVTTYLGGIILGSGADWSRLSGPYLVAADHRSADVETRAAVTWAGSALPVGSRIVADRYPAAMLAGETRLYPVVEPERGLEPASLYFADGWGEPQTRIVRGLGIRYLYVDSRLSQGLPRFGQYFHPGESQGPERLTAGDLAKFAAVPGLSPVYRHGPVTIYDTAGLRVPSPADGWTGESRPSPAVVDVLVGVLLGCTVLVLRRRFTGWRSAVGAAGPVGVTVTAAALLLFAGAVALGLRILPGPLLTAGLVVTCLVPVAGRAVAAALRPAHRDETRPIASPRPLMLASSARVGVPVALGVLLAVLGLVLAWRAAWLVDSVQVGEVLAALVPGLRAA